MKKCLFSIAGFLFSGLALAQEEIPVGVWNGFVGDQPIVACFNGGDGAGTGNYYYKSHLNPIPLDRGDAPHSWREFHERQALQDQYVWKLSKPADGAMTGEWSDPKSKRVLPIRLERVADVSELAACASDAYNLALEKKPLKVQRGKPITVAPGRAYREVVFANQETIELISEEAGIPKINAALKPDQKKGTVEYYFEQRREFLGRHGGAGSDQYWNRIVGWHGKLITISFVYQPAGQGASGVGITYRTWNVETGQELNLWGWFGMRAGRLSSTFVKLMLGRQNTADCRNGIQYKNFEWEVKAGSFYLAHTGPSDKCPDSLILPFAKAAALMTPSGRKAFESNVGPLHGGAVKAAD